MPGVSVGHHTLADGECQTGVTAIVPPGDLFNQPLPCGSAVLNGFAKPLGLVQLNELGELQTPILLSNTFAVGTLFNAMVRRSCPALPADRPRQRHHQPVGTGVQRRLPQRYSGDGGA